MKCPKCDAEKTKVIESRYVGGGMRHRRRRACACGYRYTSIELTTEDFDALQERITQLTKQVIAMNSFKNAFRELFKWHDKMEGVDEA